MASIRKEILIDAPPEQVWSALRDWGALHERLAPGFITDTKLDGNDRIVTFFDGATVREVLIGLDDDTHRLSWTIVDGPYTHHNGSAETIADGEDRTRFVWTTDLLPNELATPTEQRMERGINVIKQNLESAAGRG